MSRALPDLCPGGVQGVKQKSLLSRDTRPVYADFSLFTIRSQTLFPKLQTYCVSPFWKFSPIGTSNLMCRILKAAIGWLFKPAGAGSSASSPPPSQSVSYSSVKAPLTPVFFHHSVSGGAAFPSYYLNLGLFSPTTASSTGPSLTSLQPSPRGLWQLPERAILKRWI